MIVAGLVALAIATGPLALAAPGDLDPAFGTAGVQLLTEPGFRLGGMVRQPDGHLVVAGTVYNSPNVTGVVLRFTSEGSPDTTFASGGRFELPDTIIEALVARPDGSLLAGGVAFDIDGSMPGLVIGLTSSGDIDTSFGVGGVAQIVKPGFSLTVRGLALTSDGAIVATGSSNQDYGSQDDVLLARFSSTGVLDTSFGGGDGLVFTNVDDTDIGMAVAIQSDGRIVVVGASALDLTSNDWIVLRYLTDGAIDSSFGTAGVVKVNQGGCCSGDLDSGDVATAVVIQPDGGIVVTGFGQPVRGYLIRLLPSGQFDPTFGVGGRVVVDLGGGRFEDIALDGTGILAAGRVVLPPVGPGCPRVQFVLARFEGDGALDPTFGTAGVVTTPETGFGSQVLLEPSGRIVVGGSGIDPQWCTRSDVVLAAYEGEQVEPPTTTTTTTSTTTVAPTTTTTTTSTTTTVAPTTTTTSTTSTTSTTTTVPPTTTTSTTSTTTTTVAPTTTTTSTTTTSTTSTTTTTVAPTTTTTSTTTTAPATGGMMTTIGGATATSGSPSSLPRTGSDPSWAVLTALVAIGGGSVLVVLARRSLGSRARR
ncbi:hypothetical protein [Rhabdothermincola sediminis]|uniref:hypothetical protein n=1 Tax=Rhabdothermincola sediminis TaxID=2751370 RepID=UPI001AA060FC|nr:hypothetical protein [Rhabdothermincola sediminis]